MIPATDMVGKFLTPPKQDMKNYPSIAVSLLFFAVKTRSDKGVAFSILKQIGKNPADIHVQAARQILKYLLGK